MFLTRMDYGLVLLLGDEEEWTTDALFTTRYDLEWIVLSVLFFVVDVRIIGAGLIAQLDGSKLESE